jgi:hypothetical protein
MVENTLKTRLESILKVNSLTLGTWVEQKFKLIVKTNLEVMSRSISV